MPTTKDIQSLKAALAYVADVYKSKVAKAVDRALGSAEQERTAQVKKELDSLYDE